MKGKCAYFEEIPDLFKVAAILKPQHLSLNKSSNIYQ